MFAINHAATSLLIKKRHNDVPILWILVSVHFMESLWILLNYLDIEHFSTEAVITYIGDVHLYYMPFSHSVISILSVGIVAWFILSKVCKKPTVGIAVCIGVISHLIADLLTHANEIVLSPTNTISLVQLSLYRDFPFIAFLFELLYGIVCWFIYKGRIALLVTIVLFNLANFPFFKVIIPGVGPFLAHHHILIITIIFLQIILTSIFVFIFSNKTSSLVLNKSQIKER